MLSIYRVAFKGMLRDRVFHGVLVTAVAFLAVPAVATLSMRQVTELSLTLSLSLVSLMLLLLSVFLGGTTVWRDIERRYTFSVLGLPISRAEYLLGKFFAVSAFILLTTTVLGIAAFAISYVIAGIYPPDRPILWMNVGIAIVFDCLKYILLIAFAFLFSSFSTSFLLPVFGTIAIYFVGNASQEAYDFVNSSYAQKLAPATKQAATVLYHVLPNFNAFNFKVNAVYALPIPAKGLILTAGYFVIYTSAVLALAVLVFERREMK